MKPSEFDFLAEEGDSHWWQVGMRAVTMEFLLRQRVYNPLFEIGCGTGHFLRDAKRRGLTASGCDLSPYAVKHARRIAGDPPILLAEAAEAIEQLDSLPVTFVLNDVLPQNSFDELSVLAKLGEHAGLHGSKVLVRVPAYQFLYGPHDRWVGQHRRYTLTSLRELFARVDFAVTDWTYANCFALPAYSLLSVVSRLMTKYDQVGKSLNANHPRLVNDLARRGLLLEAQAISRGRRLPFGSSLLAFAERPASN